MMPENKVYHPELNNHMDYKCGQGNVIHSHTWIGNNVAIGNNCKIEAFTFIPDGVTIEDDVFVGPHVCFTNDKYPPSKGKHWRKTLVKKGASICANCTIVCGVTIGENALVGAGSVVAKDVPDGQVWYGNPAVFKNLR